MQEVSELAKNRKAALLFKILLIYVVVSVLFFVTRDGRELLREIRWGLDSGHQAHSALTSCNPLDRQIHIVRGNFLECYGHSIVHYYQ